jgi:hypothetical protein
MNEPMLLANRGVGPERDLDEARRDPAERRPNVLISPRLAKLERMRSW